MKKEKKKKKKCCWGRLTRVQFAGLCCSLFVVSSVLGVFVVGRWVALHELNSARVQVKELRVADPMSTGNGTVRMQFKGAVDKSTPIHVRVSRATVDVYADLRVVPVGLLPARWVQPRRHHKKWAKVGEYRLPELQFSAGESLDLDIDSTFRITDVDLFAAYSMQLVERDEITFRGKASIDVHADLGLFTVPYTGLAYDNTLKMFGFSGLQNVRVDNFDLPRNNPDGPGVLLEVNATLFNPRPVYVPVGSLYVDVFVFSNSTGRLGQVHVPAFQLQPGDNSLFIHGVLDPSQSTDNSIEDFMSSYVAGETVHVEIRGNRVANSREPDWIRALVSVLQLTMPVESTLKLDVVRGIDIHSVNVTFNDAGNPVIGSNVSTHFHNPFGFPLQVLQIGMDVVMLDLTTQSREIARMSVPLIPIQSRMGEEEVNVQFGSTVLSVFDQAGFDELVVAMMERPNMTVTTNVVCRTVIDSAMHVMHISRIPIHGINVTIAGMDGFRTVSVTNGALVSASGPSPNRFLVDSEVIIGNPAPIAADVGVIRVNVTYVPLSSAAVPKPNPIVIGNAVIPQARLSLKQSTLLGKATVLVSDDNSDAISEFFARYVVRDPDIFVGMHGRPDSTDIALLNPVLSHTALQLNFQPPPYQFIVSVRVVVDVLKIAFGGVNAYVKAFNPLPVDVIVNFLDIDVYDTDDNLIYTMKLDAASAKRKNGQPPFLTERPAAGAISPLADSPLLVKAGTHELHVPVPLGGLHWGVVKDIIGVLKDKSIRVRLDGRLGFNLDKFTRRIDYKASHVDAKIEINFL